MKRSLGFSTLDNRFKAHLTDEALNKILSLSRASKMRETGGILFGHYSDDGVNAYITKVSGPGRGSKHGFASFFRAVGQLQEWLDALWGDGRGYYLGEWHFHPMSSPTPSSTDRKQMFEIAQNSKASCPEPILVILGGNPKGRWILSVSIFTRKGEAFELGQTDGVSK
jgi:integrative and conjugative element protein (TIGR02256 family)